MDQERPGIRGNLAFKHGSDAGPERVLGRPAIAWPHDNDSELSDDSSVHGKEQPGDGGAVLYGMWVDDGRPGRFETNIHTFEQLQHVIAQHAQDGFYPADIFGSGRFFEPWSVAFVGGEAPGNVWHVTADASAFKRRHEDMLRQGYRLASFSRRHRNFNAVWEPRSTPAQPVAWNMGWSELMSLDRQQRDRGLRIATLDRYGPSGAHYAAVWEPGDGEQMIEAPGGLNAGMPSPLASAVDRYADAGLFVQAIGHNEHMVVAYRSDATLATRRFACLPPARFRAYEQNSRTAGYRLAAISHAGWPGN